MKNNENKIVLLIGSEWGETKRSGTILLKYLKTFGFSLELKYLDDIVESSKSLNITFNKNDYYIILISTAINGDSPKNSKKFMRFLKKMKKNAEKNIECDIDFRELNFALAAFGDEENYPSTFCKPGKNMKNILCELNANMITQEVLVGSKNSDENQFTEWYKNLANILQKKKEFAECMQMNIEEKEKKIFDKHIIKYEIKKKNNFIEKKIYHIKTYNKYLHICLINFGIFLVFAGMIIA